MTWVNKGLDLLAVTYAILFFPAPIFWLIIHPAIRFWRRFGNRAYWIAPPLWIASGYVLVALRHKIFATRVGRNALTWVFGSILILLALWISRHVHRDFGFRRLAGIPEIKPESSPSGVVRSGIYAHLRHPRYVEYMLTFSGLAFLTGATGIFLLAFITILLYLIVAPLEERELRNQYGSEYEAYGRSVPRFLPRFVRKKRVE